MAHIYFLTRGIKHMDDLFLSQLQSQFYDWKRTNEKTQKDEISKVQGALRPINLYEYVLPEESIPEFLTSIGLAGQEPGFFGQGWAKRLTGVFRKLLGAEVLDTKNIKPVKTTKVISSPGAGLNIIGWKKDVRKSYPWGYFQEGL